LAACKYFNGSYNGNMGILSKIFAGNTLYYPGCLTKFALPEHIEKYKKLLELEGIDFVMLKDKELCCGSPAKNAGAEEKFKIAAKKNLEAFRQHGIKRIISNCPACVAIFRKEYPKVLGKQWNIEVFHVTEILNNSLEKLKNVDGKKATYHDPCHLGRVLGIYDQPREVIKKAGYQLVEMELSREDSFCCGGGGGVRSNEPDLSGRIGADRTTQAKKTGSEVLITACPMCYAQLKKNVPNGLKVLEFVDLFEL